MFLGDTAVAFQVKSPLARPASCQNPTALLPMLIPANIPGKVGEDAQSAWDSASSREIPLKILTWPLPDASCYGRLRSEPIDKISLHLFLFPKLCFPIKTFFSRNVCVFDLPLAIFLQLISLIPMLNKLKSKGLKSFK